MVNNTYNIFAFVDVYMNLGIYNNINSNLCLHNSFYFILFCIFFLSRLTVKRIIFVRIVCRFFFFRSTRCYLSVCVFFALNSLNWYIHNELPLHWVTKIRSKCFSPYNFWISISKTVSHIQEFYNRNNDNKTHDKKERPIEVYLHSNARQKFFYSLLVVCVCFFVVFEFKTFVSSDSILISEMPKYSTLAKRRKTNGGCSKQNTRSNELLPFKLKFTTLKTTWIKWIKYTTDTHSCKEQKKCLRARKIKEMKWKKSSDEDKTIYKKSYGSFIC